MKLGGWEIFLILLIVLIVFGVGKLPQVGKAIGDGIREFKRAQRGEDEPAKTAEAAKTAPQSSEKKA